VCSLKVNFVPLKLEICLGILLPSIICPYAYVVKHTHLFQVVATGKITGQDRMSAWRDLQEAAVQKKTRPFFREVDKHGRMYAGKYQFS
jgi:hypothetical protein